MTWVTLCHNVTLLHKKFKNAEKGQLVNETDVTPRDTM
jgi:hypothetical protein